jgi:hypothetical protein
LLRSQVLDRFQQLLSQRGSSAAFHPKGRQRILDLGPNVFAVLRIPPHGHNNILCLQNVTPQSQSIEKYSLKPYQTLWLDVPGTK